MISKFVSLSAMAAAALIGLSACSDKEVINVAEPAPTPVPEGAVLVPEMKPTGDLASSYGTAPVGSAGAEPTGSAVPEMTPTGNMKQAVNPNQPSQPAGPPPK